MTGVRFAKLTSLFETLMHTSVENSKKGFSGLSKTVITEKDFFGHGFYSGLRLFKTPLRDLSRFSKALMTCSDGFCW